MRAGRLVDMLLTLQHRGRLTAGQLAEHLEVSVRTVLRDVEALSSAGVPIYSVPGVGGGIDLVEGFRTRLTGLTNAEAASVLLAGQPLLAHRLGLGVDAAGARRKLIEAVPAETRPHAEAIDRWFLHDPDSWEGHRIPHGELRRLASAIEQRVEVELTFTDRQLVVRPLGLVLKAGEWFVVSGNETFDVVAIDDLRGTRITQRPFVPPAEFELSTVWQAFVATRRTNDRTIEVTRQTALIEPGHYGGGTQSTGRRLRHDGSVDGDDEGTVGPGRGTRAPVSRAATRA